MGKSAEFIRERREVGAGALGPGPGTLGSQVRNDGRLHRPSLKVASAALMTPAGNLSTASALSGIPPRVKPIQFPRSPLESPQPARLRPGLSGWTRCPLSGHPCFHVLCGPTCVLAVNLKFEVLPMWPR